MLKKNNIPIEDVMKAVAKENGFTYIPPEKRRPKKLVFKKEDSGDIVVSLKDITASKNSVVAPIEKHVQLNTSGVSKSKLKPTYKRKRKSGMRKTNGKSSSSAKNYG